MYRMPAPWRVMAVLAIVVAVAASRPAAQVFPGVSLRVSQELVPPGGVAQVKLLVTEPKPISTAGGRLSFGGFDQLDGIAINSPADDTFGVAIVDGTILDVSVVSRTASFGTGPEYPVLTVAGRVPATTPLGVRFPVDVDAASLRLLDASGTVYPTELRNGYVQTAPGVSIDNVNPGSADLPAGSVVRVAGTGFVPGTRIRFDETSLAFTRFVSSSRIDVVLAVPARMHGMRVRAVNPTGARATYYSYQRTIRFDPSLQPVFRDAVPLFPHRADLSTVVDLTGASNGLAVQNIQPSGTTLVAELFGPDGSPLSSVRFKLPGNRFFVQEISELFLVPAPAGSTVRVRSKRPVQVMGIGVDASGAATPLLPR